MSASASGEAVDAFLSREVGQLGDADVQRDPPEVEPLAPRHYGQGHLVGLGGRQDEDRVGRRLLQRLEQGVERLRGQHVDLVDDVYPVAPLGRPVAHPVAHVPYVVDAAVARRVDLEEVHRPAFVDRGARRALVVGLPILWAEAVQRLGEDARSAGLARAAGAAEQVGVGRPPLVDRVAEGARDHLLPDDLVEPGGPPLPVEDLAHPGSPKAAADTADLPRTPSPLTGEGWGEGENGVAPWHGRGRPFDRLRAGSHPRSLACASGRHGGVVG